MIRHLFAAAAAALALPAAAAGPDPRAGDRAEIEKLMWTYSRAIDRFDADAYVAVFTPDGAFGQTRGRDALHKMVDDLKKRRTDGEAKGEAQPAMHHLEGNQFIEFVGPDHARVHYYWMTLFGTSPPKDPPRVAAIGNGMDDVVRVNGRWLIKQRNVTAAE